MNFTEGSTADDLLSLDKIRQTLIRLEDSIIFALIERSQFAWNRKIYRKGEFEELDKLEFDGSWLDWFLFETECFHAKARRYTSPDEHPFTPISKLPPPVIAPQTYPSLLHPASTNHPSTNANERIKKFYVEHVVPAVTKWITLGEGGRGRRGSVITPTRPVFALKSGSSEQDVGKNASSETSTTTTTPEVDDRDDGNYGSSATIDVTVLQSLSRRIHFGMFVSESKFRSAPHLFVPHILSSPPNSSALEGLITKPAVEAALLVRLGNKARIYGRELDPQGRLKVQEEGEGKSGDERIDWEDIVGLYRDWVIPLTKDVEVDYLIHRLDGVPQSQIDAWMAAGEENA